jgi:hypothetical protein
MAVNKSIEVANVIQWSDKANVVVCCQTFSDAIRDNTHSLAAVWADYCGTFAGSRRCQPKRDLSNLFASGHLQHGSVLALTHSRRSSKSQNVRGWLHKTARKHDFRLRVQREITYYPSMSFLLCRLSRMDE